MNKKVLLNIMSFVLLALMFFKVSSLHVYAHQNDDADKIENCKICDSAVENQQAEYTAPIKTEVTSIEKRTFELKPICQEAQIFTSSKISARHFCRPPPSLA